MALGRAAAAALGPGPVLGSAGLILFGLRPFGTPVPLGRLLGRRANQQVRDAVAELPEQSIEPATSNWSARYPQPAPDEHIWEAAESAHL